MQDNILLKPKANLSYCISILDLLSYDFPSFETKTISRQRTAFNRDTSKINMIYGKFNSICQFGKGKLWKKVDCSLCRNLSMLFNLLDFWMKMFVDYIIDSTHVYSIHEEAKRVLDRNNKHSVQYRFNPLVSMPYFFWDLVILVINIKFFVMYTNMLSYSLLISFIRYATFSIETIWKLRFNC